MINRRSLLSTTLGAGAGALLARVANAQSYPNRTVKIVSPFPPGGSSDFVQRLVADRLQATAQATLRDRESTGRRRRHRRRQIGRDRRARRLHALVQLARPAGHCGRHLPQARLRPGAELRADRDDVHGAADPRRASLGRREDGAGARRLCQSNGPARSNSVPPATARQPHMLGEMLRTRGRHRHHPHPLSRRRSVRYRRHGRPGADDLRSDLGADVHMCNPAGCACSPSAPRNALEAHARRRRPPPKQAFRRWSRASGPATSRPPAPRTPIIDKLNATINGILRSPEAQTGLARLSAEASASARRRTLPASSRRRRHAGRKIAKAAKIQVD